jgi:hypothetical protein
MLAQLNTIMTIESISSEVAVPFPTEDDVTFKSAAEIPTITFSVRGNVSSTSYSVGISSREDPNRFVLLLNNTPLDRPQRLSGPGVTSVADFAGRRLKWLIGITSMDKTDTQFSIDVVCAQDGATCPNPTHASGQLTDGAEMAYGFFDCSVV